MIGNVRVKKFALHLITRGQCPKMGSGFFVFFFYVSVFLDIPFKCYINLCAQ